jgi:hypothetical protein
MNVIFNEQNREIWRIVSPNLHSMLHVIQQSAQFSVLCRILANSFVKFVIQRLCE